MDKQSLRNTEANIEESNIARIIKYFPDQSFIQIDGFDEAIIGVDDRQKLLIYSVQKIVQKLMEEMSVEDAKEYYAYNIESAYLGEKTPILCYDLEGFI